MEKEMETEYTGYKFLSREMASDYDASPWEIGVWRKQKVPTEWRDGQACGVGLHLMRIPDPVYCRYEMGFLAIGRGLIGSDRNKMRFEQVKLVRPLKFSEIFFPGADLTRANLTWANLTRANLTRANLTRAYLTEADLIEANLTRANLTRANLTWANLTRANLFRATLIEANLFRANLTGADLTEADLIEANLFRANLTGADLRDADLTGAHGLTGIAGLSEVQKKQIHC